MDWGELIQAVLETVIAIMLPILLGYAVVWLRAKQKEIIAGLTDSQRWMLTEAVEMAVKAAEQSGLAGHIGTALGEKKRFAIDAAERYLVDAGLGSIDVDVLADMIEAEVYRQFKPQPAPPALPDPPIRLEPLEPPVLSERPLPELPPLPPASW